MTTKKIAIVTADDWQGIYVDGKLVNETHRLHLDDILDICEVEREDLRVDQDWMERKGSLPESLKDIPKRVLSK